MNRSIAEDHVDLWVAHPDRARAAELVDRYRSLLSDDEAARAARFRFDEHRHEYLITRALVRTVLSRYRDIAPEAWRFSKNAYGRPSIEPPCGLTFNLSNTASLVVCAVSEHRELGVDVEALSRARDILEVADTVFSSTELAELRALGSAAAEDRAVSLWTLKEAYMKARGMGMSLPATEITLRFPAGRAPELSTSKVIGDAGERWELRTIDLDAHRIALAVEVGNAPIVVDVLPLVPLASS